MRVRIQEVCCPKFTLSLVSNPMPAPSPMSNSGCGPYPMSPRLPDVTWASAQLRDGGSGYKSDWPKVTNEDLPGASKTTLRPGQMQSLPELRQAVLNGGDKSAAPGLPRTPLTCPWLTAPYCLRD